MEHFEGKVAVITGAANGIGKALAKKCLEEKMKVVIADIDSSNLEKCINELKIVGQDITAVVTDVSNQESINNLAEITIKHHGKVNLLFNNAGIAGPIGPIWQTDFPDLQQVINVNLMSVIYGVRAFIPVMLKQNDECYIVNTASGAGLHTAPHTSGYTLTKHAVVSLTEVLYYDLKQQNIDNIHVSILCPGSVNTNFAEKLQSKETNSQTINQVISYFKKHLKQGITIEAVAEKTFAAIRKNQFYILTHSAHKDLVKNRLEDIINERNPSHS